MQVYHRVWGRRSADRWAEICRQDETAQASIGDPQERAIYSDWTKD
jgi:hypothetical protein